MKKYLLSALLLALGLTGLSQGSFKQNSAYLELGGNGTLLSLNYERQLSYQPGLGFRAGAGFYSASPFELTIPVGVNYLFNLYNRKVFAELGFGVTYTKADVKLYIIIDRKEPYTENYSLNYVPSAGLRIHTRNDFLWRFSLSPVINHNGFIPWVGLSFGKVF